ncbi:MAG TPA: hypothetical protein VM165_11215 [Planctomycetaceae bacterium]|nr:hypothetical protein [Planctomycetaceae bacterium]
MFRRPRWSPRTLLAGLGLAAVVGCAMLPRQAATTNAPVFVRANDGDVVWERTVDVVHTYLFEIERENRLDGIIETRYKTGASALEPWHADSVGAANRWESTLQSIRRKAFVSVTPVNGGYLVNVEAIKELEDVPRAANSTGAATFLDNNPLQRDLNVVVGQATPSGWIPRGRDAELERSMLGSIAAAFNRP